MAEYAQSLEELLAPHGGFRIVYKRLLAYACQTLAQYQSNSGGGVLLRQLEPQDLVHHAVDRILSDGQPPSGNVYYRLRRHIHNKIRSTKKNVGESKLARPGGRPEIEIACLDFEDMDAVSPAYRAEVTDEVDFFKVLFEKVISEEEQDTVVRELASALISGSRDSEKLCEYLEITPSQLRNAYRRLKTRVLKIVPRNFSEKEL